MLHDTVVIWMGEFGRTPRINGNAGRDHWARSWCVVVGGGGIKGGQAVGATERGRHRRRRPSRTRARPDGQRLPRPRHRLETRFTASNGRPMKIANSGKLIKELFS